MGSDAASADISDELRGFLKANGLYQYESTIGALAREVHELNDVTDDELSGIGMSRLHVRRLRNAVGKRSPRSPKSAKSSKSSS